MVKSVFIYCCFLFISFNAFAQAKSDSSQRLEEIVVKGYETNSSLLALPASVSKLNKAALQFTSAQSLVPAFNTVAGVRLEERSPGSYRLSIRGSLLRSPFGVRNVKLYLDDFILTDAGGNTYLNLLDANMISGAEIIKGPAGSYYGGGTGGAVLLNTTNAGEGDSSSFSFALTGGRFGTVIQNASYQKQLSTISIQVMQGHTQADGYRIHSGLRKDNIMLSVKLKNSEKSQSDFLLLLADLFYKTPGGLTQAQLLANPRQSRPATAVLPSAIEQRASIRNQTLLLGYSNQYALNENWKIVSSLTTSITGFANPFITNFEKRNEGNVGIRNKLVYETNRKIPLQWTSGVEVQRGNYRIDSSGNNRGVSDGNKVSDRIIAAQQFVFTQVSLNPIPILNFQGGISLNGFDYSLERTKGLPVSGEKKINFNPQALPRIALSIHPIEKLTIYAQWVKGYSSPTVAEIRPSAGGIFEGLQAEYGWNKEVGVKMSGLRNRLFLSAVLFQFELKDAIVRQVNSAGAEYFINAGSVSQKGLELESNWVLIRPNKSWFSNWVWRQSYTRNRFEFVQYTLGVNNYSGNALTGVPKEMYASTIQAEFFSKLYLNASYNRLGKTPLNDANTFFAEGYELWQIKIGLRMNHKKFKSNIYLIGDNITNRAYSLGNDINAFGGRFYNPAATRNLQIGYSIQF